MAKPKMSDVLELSVAERIQFVQDVWDTIASVPQSMELSAEQKQEIDRRVESLDRNPESAIPWDQLKARLGM